MDLRDYDICECGDYRFEHHEIVLGGESRWMGCGDLARMFCTCERFELFETSRERPTDMSLEFRYV